MSWSNLYYYLVFTAALSIAASAVDASLIISEWSLSTGIINPSGESVGEGSYSVQNPFTGTQAVSIPGPPPSSAQTAYDFAWSDDSGTFSITAAHQAADISGNFLRSLSSGTIWLTPSVDTLFTGSGSYHYDLPVAFSGFAFALFADNGLGGGQQITYFAAGDEVFLQAGAGTLTLGGQGILPAGVPARIHYDFFLDTYGATGTVATGSGNISFTLQPVPEPGAACLLLVSVFLFQPPERPCKTFVAILVPVPRIR